MPWQPLIWGLIFSVLISTTKVPRYIEPAKAIEIIQTIPGFVDTAGIFVNADVHNIHELTNPGFLNWIQLHGDETPQFCEQFSAWNLGTIKGNSRAIQRVA